MKYAKFKSVLSKIKEWVVYKYVRLLYYAHIYKYDAVMCAYKNRQGFTVYSDYIPYKETVHIINGAKIYFYL